VRAVLVLMCGYVPFKRVKSARCARWATVQSTLLILTPAHLQPARSGETAGRAQQAYSQGAMCVLVTLAP
jgi:hypothetical protein